MGAHPMDNPVWHSLTTEQRSFAIGTEDALRYPADIAPFVAVGADDERSRTAALDLVAPGEAMYFVGVAPNDLTGWELLSASHILQMMWDPSTPLSGDGRGIVTLTANDAPDMVALTTLAFPGFFRTRTYQLGRYIGIRDNGLLVSMAGERMRATGLQEISGVCTHPQHVGRGHSAKLNTAMIDSICARGMQPFLHVSSDNVRAQSLYRRLGFVTRAEIRLWYVRKR